MPGAFLLPVRLQMKLRFFLDDRYYQVRTSSFPPFSVLESCETEHDCLLNELPESSSGHCLAEYLLAMINLRVFSGMAETKTSTAVWPWMF